MAAFKRKKPGHRKRMAYLRGRLLERRRKLISGIEAEIQAQAKRLPSEPSDPVDVATESSVAEMGLRIAEMGSIEVLEIENALRKIKDGTYGLCVNCGKRIPSARLEAVPAASMCLSCQERLERGGAERELAGRWHRIVDEPGDEPSQTEVMKVYVEGG